MDEPTPGSGGFLKIEHKPRSYDASSVVVWPVPYERTTSWKRGTNKGPEAILEASAYLEEYDDELDWEPSSVGIHTLPATDPSSMDESAGIDLLYTQARRYMEDDKFVLTLGGEHTLSTPIVRAAREKYANLSVLQIDAHADLRDTHEGTVYSHACVMRRIVDICPAVQVGIRSISAEEKEMLPKLQTRIFFARDIAGNSNWIDEIIAALSDHVYLTIDVDGLDPSIVPATGTPEPGGLGWYPLLELLRRVGRERTLVSADVVELMPREGLHAADFLCAKLAYKIVSYALKDQPNPLM